MKGGTRVAGRKVGLALGLGLGLGLGGGMFSGVARAAEGLVAEYTDGARRVTEVVAAPQFSLLENESIHPAVRPAFSAVWTGKLKVLAPGRYRFEAAPAKMTLDGRAVGEAAVSLGAGEHALRLEYRRPPGKARLQIAWASDGFGLEPVPPAAFVTDAKAGAADLWQRVGRGRALAEEMNCRGCHAGGERAPGAAAADDRSARGRGPILSNAGGRLSPAWILKWLENPAAYRPNARMPVIALSDAERRDVTAFLATLVEGGHTDPRELGEAGPAATPAERAELAAKGKQLGEAIGCKACHGDQGAGLISLAAVGSKMSLRALHVYLLTPDKIEPTGRMPSLLLKEDEAAAIATFLAGRKNPAFERPVPAGGDAGRGRALVESRGCLGCHTVERGATALVSSQKAPAFAALKAGRGCLSKSPPAAAPRFRMDDADRAALGAYLENGDVAESPLADTRRAFEYHRCNACHEIGRAPLVAFAQAPPALNDTGNKLRVPWLREVIGGRTRMRHWIETRMPSFPRRVAERVAPGLAALAGASRDDPPGPPKPDALTLRDGVRHIGRGDEGLACVNCHDFAWHRSGAATPAPDMSTMAERMRPEWFRRWLLDPQRIQPGTQMPSYFVEVEKGVVDRKISAMWAALSLGRDMPLPEGVTADSRAVKLQVKDRPLVYRTFVTGGSVRSILVGFPGGVSYSWDADACRLELAWTGEFVDMRAVWNERGGQKAVVLGERFFIAGEGSPLRLDAPDSPANPTAFRFGNKGGKAALSFKGYTLDKGGVPTWMYEVDGAQVVERITPAEDGPGLVRRFEVKAKKPREVFYVPSSSEGVDVSAEGASGGGAGPFRATASPGKPARFTVTMRARKAPATAVEQTKKP